MELRRPKCAHCGRGARHTHRFRVLESPRLEIDLPLCRYHAPRALRHEHPMRFFGKMDAREIADFYHGVLVPVRAALAALVANHARPQMQPWRPRSYCAGDLARLQRWDPEEAWWGVGWSLPLSKIGPAAPAPPIAVEDFPQDLLALMSELPGQSHGRTRKGERFEEHTPTESDVYAAFPTGGWHVETVATGGPLGCPPKPEPASLTLDAVRWGLAGAYVAAMLEAKAQGKKLPESKLMRRAVLAFPWLEVSLIRPATGASRSTIYRWRKSETETPQPVERSDYGDHQQEYTQHVTEPVPDPSPRGASSRRTRPGHRGTAPVGVSDRD
jgi:hypothetical protein